MKKIPGMASRKDRDMLVSRKYDFSGGVRGKYASTDIREGTEINGCRLDDDVAEMFPDCGINTYI